MKERVKTGLLLALIAIAIFGLRFISPFIFDTFVFVLIIMAEMEVIKAINIKEKKCSAFWTLFYVICNTAIFVVSVILKWTFWTTVLYNLIAFAFIFILSLCCYIIIKSHKNVNNLAKGKIFKLGLLYSLRTLFAMIYPTFLLSSLYYVNHIDLFSTNSQIASIGSNFGLFCLLMIFILTVATDTSAYFVGRAFKGVKLAPKISPNKTISGSVGGIFASIIVSLIIFLIFNSIDIYNATFSAINLNGYWFILYGFVISIFSQAGDLFASLIKRKQNIKDYSNLLGEHGGIMDRFDGETFVAPITLLMIVLFI